MKKTYRQESIRSHSSCFLEEDHSFATTKPGRAKLRAVGGSGKGHYMNPVGFGGMVLLIFLLIGGNISANILSENYIERNGRTVLQLMVSVDSGSMSPNLNIGDLVVVESISKNDIITYAEADLTGYKSFNLPGDVIVYRPYGKDSLTHQDECQLLLGNSSGQDKATPIIHRALSYVKTGEPMWKDGPNAPFSGYITKGDHNDVIDQMAGQMFGMANMSYIDSHRDEIMNVGNDRYLDKNTGLIIYKTENGTFVGEGISYLVPVKDEWILGVVRTKIPYGRDWTKLSFS